MRIRNLFLRTVPFELGPNKSRPRRESERPNDANPNSHDWSSNKKTGLVASHLKTVLNIVMTPEGEEAAQQLVDRQGQAVDVVGVTLHTIGQAFKRGERFCSINPR
jgi:hypothetical protein